MEFRKVITNKSGQIIYPKDDIPIKKCSKCMFANYLRPIYIKEWDEYVYSIECGNTNSINFRKKQDIDDCNVPCDDYKKDTIIHKLQLFKIRLARRL